ncbi:hypothetical protein ACOSQ4_005423 [Xanthoceras sorbifolium]
MSSRSVSNSASFPITVLSNLAWKISFPSCASRPDVVPNCMSPRRSSIFSLRSPMSLSMHCSNTSSRSLESAMASSILANLDSKIEAASRDLSFLDLLGLASLPRLGS